MSRENLSNQDRKKISESIGNIQKHIDYMREDISNMEEKFTQKIDEIGRFASKNIEKTLQHFHDRVRQESIDPRAFSKSRIVLIDGKKAKIIETYGENLSVVFQSGGKYSGKTQLVNTTTTFVESLHVRKLQEKKSKEK